MGPVPEFGSLTTEQRGDLAEPREEAAQRAPDSNLGVPSEESEKPKSPEISLTLEQLKKGLQDLSTERPPSALEGVGHATHVYRLSSDHLRHLSQLGYITTEFYKQKGFEFFGTLSETTGELTVSSLNIVTGACLVIGVIPNLASKLGLLMTYRKRMIQVEDQIKEKEEAIERITGHLQRDPSNKDLAMTMVLLQRELQECKIARDDLRNSKFRMGSAANNVMEIAAGAARVTKIGVGLAGGASPATTHVLANLVPGLGIATGAFWAAYGSILTVKSLLAFHKVDKKLGAAEERLFFCDPVHEQEYKNFRSYLVGENVVIERMSAKRIKKELQKYEKSAAGVSPEKLKAYMARIKNPPTQVAMPTQTRLFQRCCALKKALLEKKVQLLTLERKKQLLKICHFALLATVGLLGIAAGTAGIVLSGGTLAVPILLALFIPLFIVGGGILSTDIVVGITETEKKKLERLGCLTPKIKQKTGIRSLKDLIPLCNEIWNAYQDLNQREQFLKQIGVDLEGETEEETKKKRELLTSEAGILRLLYDHFSDLFPKEGEPQIRRLLQTFSIEHCTTPEDLADDILKLREVRREFLKSLQISEEEIKGENEQESKEKLEKILEQRYPNLFIEEEMLRRAIFQTGIHCISTPQQLAGDIHKLSTKEDYKGYEKALELLDTLGIARTAVYKKVEEKWQIDTETLKKILENRYADLFPTSDSALDLLHEYNIQIGEPPSPEQMAGTVLGLAEPDKSRLCSRLGLSSKDIKERELKPTLVEVFSRLFRSS